MLIPFGTFDMCQHSYGGLRLVRELAEAGSWPDELHVASLDPGRPFRKCIKWGRVLGQIKNGALDRRVFPNVCIIGKDLYAGATMIDSYLQLSPSRAQCPYQLFRRVIAVIAA